MTQFTWRYHILLVSFCDSDAWAKFHEAALAEQHCFAKLEARPISHSTQGPIS